MKMLHKILQKLMEFGDKLPKPVIHGYNSGIELIKCNYYSEDGHLRVFAPFEAHIRGIPVLVSGARRMYDLKAIKVYTKCNGATLAWEIGSNIKDLSDIPLRKLITVKKYWRMINFSLWIFDLGIIENYPDLQQVKSQ